MPRFKVTHKPTGEIVELETTNINTALEEKGWSLLDCVCKLLPAEPEKKPQKASASVEHRQKVRAEEKAEKDKVAEEPIVVEPSPCEKHSYNKEGCCEFCGAPEPPEPGQVSEQPAPEEPGAAVAVVGGVIGMPSEAESKALAHKEQIEALAISAEVMFLKMGQLLYYAREGAEWTILRYETYKEYVEDLKLPMTNSYSWATRLSNIFEYLVKNMGLDEKLLAEIGVAKLTRLLPLARKGELTMEVLEAARILSDLDLRAELGHNVGESDEEDMIICSRCGEQFDAKKATRVK